MKRTGIACGLAGLFLCGAPLWSAAPETRASSNPFCNVLVQACRDGSLNRVEILLDRGAPIDGASGQYQFTPLTSAADGGHLDLLSFLIRKGANVNLPDIQSSTPLLHACYQDHLDCIKALLDAGADPNIGSKWNRFPLMYSAQRGNDDAVAALLAHHADLNANCEDGPAIWWAVIANRPGTVRLLAEAGADLNLNPTGPPHPDNLPYSLLGLTAAMGQVELLDYFLKRGVAVDQPGRDGTTALMCAAYYHMNDAQEKLLAAGAKVDQVNQLGQTALMTGAMQGEIANAYLLVTRGAKMNLQDKKERTALMWACKWLNRPVASFLLEHGADVNLADARGETALTYAGNRGEVEMVDNLKAHGAKKTSLHIIPPDDATKKKVPAERAWALAVGAVYCQRDGLNPAALGGGRTQTNARRLLNSGWKIHNREELLTELDQLRNQGQRTAYRQLGAQLAAMSASEYQGYLELHPERSSSLQAARDSYRNWKDRSALAWDLCRAAMLTGNGYAAGYLDETEAWSQLLVTARQVQDQFQSWEEMSANYLKGREIWANGKDPHFEACAQLLLNPTDPNSPWNQLPWKTSLPPAAKE